jgi:hypothetical protein
MKTVNLTTVDTLDDLRAIVVLAVELAMRDCCCVRNDLYGQCYKTSTRMRGQPARFMSGYEALKEGGIPCSSPGCINRHAPLRRHRGGGAAERNRG